MTTTILLADIGGTNTRCAIGTSSGAIEHLQVFRNAGFPQLQPLLGTYLSTLSGAQRPRRAALAIAAPVQGDEVRMPNIDWHFSRKTLQQSLALDELLVLNDFAAIARALPALRPEDLLAAGSGAPAAGFPKLVLGPGTGLGVASLVPVGQRWQILAGEGGHVTLAASDDVEAALIGRARERLGHCSAERLLSGSGLTLLHQLMHGGTPLSGQAIGERIVAGDGAAAATLDAFFRLLGTVAGNAALTVGALGGVYIAGGIVPRYAAQFVRSGFRQRFEARGRYRDYMRGIPTWLITAANPALPGLLQFAQEHAENRR